MAKTRKRSGPEKTAKKSNSSMNPDRAKPAAGSNMRDKSTVNRLKMYKSGGKAVRNKKGKIVKPAPFQSSVTSGEVARVAPNRKWFGNTRVISQNALQSFQDEMGKVLNDPYKGFLEAAQLSSEMYDEEKDMNLVREDDGEKVEAKESLFTKGQSKRIWNELYKVIDSSDVVIQVLDARDPMGTRSSHIESFMKKEKQHKHLIFVLNKCDLVPTWVTQRWVTVLSADYPTLAFHASVTNPFGKGALINLLRQFSKLHTDKKQISVGVIGYPNVGKSSIINTLRAKKVCNVAPIAGETKVWQYVTLMRRIYLIDCPGVVYPSGDSETDIILKGVVRVENVKDAACHIPAVLERVKREYIAKTYKVSSWNDPTDFLEQVAQRTGKLLKGGEADVNTVGKMILNDFQRGKLPYFVAPPSKEGESNSEETTKKRKTASRIPPLAESFVKEATSTAADENTTNEETVEDDGSKESNSFKDSKQETNTNTDTNNKDSAEENSQSNESTKDRTGTNGEINENTELSVQESKNVNLHVKQNFGAINVGLEYSGDDVQPLEENSEGEENITVESESEAEEDESEGEEGTGEQRDDIRAAYGKYEDEELGSEEEEEEEEEEQEKGNEKQASEVKVNTTENNCESDSEDDDYEDDSEISDEEEESENHEAQNDSVTEVNTEDESKKQRLLDKYKNLPDARRLASRQVQEWTTPTEKRFSVSVSPFIACVEAERSEEDEQNKKRHHNMNVNNTPKARPGRPKSAKREAAGIKKSSKIDDRGSGSRRRGKRKSDDDNSVDDSPKSKHPRLKTNKQKIGVRYYEAVNVKNKNRNKKAKHKEGQTGRKGRKRQ
ncbi:nucleolar GTP-binding protein 2-like isoform X4 [Orbicella faveolata]|uniref:nucleolar GTP-binding protein 2-like isoform X4 n=1 Tax=Orbicella faveolata TaxID=48498 RepID=UPI0009E32666|nr:nucleolar GTP-binding protein 2-like isoform X4 [Orbicella faveolata]